MTNDALSRGIKSAVLMYINQKNGVDYIDIRHHFSQHCNTAMCMATELADENSVRKVPGGKFFRKGARQ